MEPKKKQAEPAKPGRPESIGTSKRLKSHREKKSDKKRKQQRKNMREKRFLPSILNQGGREKEANFSPIVTTLFAL